MNIDYLRGVDTRHLFEPKYECHLEVKNFSGGNVLLIASVKDHCWLFKNDGKFYDGSILHGKVVGFYANGNKSFETEFEHGKESGKRLVCFVDGSVCSETYFKERVPYTVMTEYYPLVPSELEGCKGKVEGASASKRKG